MYSSVGFGAAFNPCCPSLLGHNPAASWEEMRMNPIYWGKERIHRETLSTVADVVIAKWHHESTGAPWLRAQHPESAHTLLCAPSLPITEPLHPSSKDAAVEITSRHHSSHTDHLIVWIYHTSSSPECVALQNEFKLLLCRVTWYQRCTALSAFRLRSLLAKKISGLVSECLL